jgi:hypothetical protein
MAADIREGDDIVLRGKVKIVDGTNITFRIAGYDITIALKADDPSIVSSGKPDMKRPCDDVV